MSEIIENMQKLAEAYAPIKDKTKEEYLDIKKMMETLLTTLTEVACIKLQMELCTNKIVAALLAQHSIEVNKAAMDCYRKVLKELEGGR